MTASRNKLVFGILSLISFGSSTYLLFSISSPYDILTASAISGFNASIMLAWLSADITGGTIITFLSVVVAGLFDLKTLFYGSLDFTLQFFLAFAIGYGFYRQRNQATHSYALREEKLEEETLAVNTSMDNRKKGIFALKRKLARYLTLKGVVESFSTILPLDEITVLVIDKALETLGKEGRALLYLVDIEKQELMLASSRNETRIKAKKGDIFDQWLLRHRRSIIVEDVTRDFRFPARDVEEAAKDLVSLIASPLISEDKVIGIIRIDSAETAYFSQDDLRLLDIIANLGAVAIQNAYLYSKTQELAIHDGLTGLFVRRYFLERLNEELKRIAARQGELAVLMIDIDHFKEYNDKYGHTAGDIVLRHLAHMVASRVRQGDIVARYGGEEIVVVLTGRGKAKAREVAEAIRREIAERPFSLRRHETNITVSIGLAQYPYDSASEEGLISVADERLYKAKRQGRNKVCST